LVEVKRRLYIKRYQQVIPLCTPFCSFICFRRFSKFLRCDSKL